MDSIFQSALFMKSNYDSCFRLINGLEASPAPFGWSSSPVAEVEWRINESQDDSKSIGVRHGYKES